MNIKTILITGARAPVALALARIFFQKGYRVIASDSFPKTLCSYSSAVAKHYRIASPVENLNTFAENLQKVICKEHVDLVIPTCEEIMFVARIQDQLTAEVFSPNFQRLEELHNKWKFAELLKQHELRGPKSYLITSPEDLSDLPKEKPMILKQIYSRFGSSLFMLYPENSLPSLKFDPLNPYIAQEFITGQKYCSYTVAIHGKITAHAEYQVLQSIGIGAGIAMKCTFHNEILACIQNFISQLNYTGQISFDFIQATNGIFYCIECNPRTTSGIHFFNHNPNVALGFIQSEQITIAKTGTIYRDPLLSFWFGIKQSEIFNSQVWKNLFHGKNPIYASFDKRPYFSIIRILFILMKMTLFKGRKFQEVMSRDIEYNGAMQ